MFNNARQFNEEGSWVYVDACEMQVSSMRLEDILQALIDLVESI
jgi:hypothetical protein